MSGGVDSSVAAALLVEQGYDVTGFFVINYEVQDKGQGDCWRPDYRDALRVAASLQIPLLRFDCREEYKRSVIDYLLTEYTHGRTPNPDVMCNKYVKFSVWSNKLAEHGFSMMATGHYAQVSCDNKGVYHLLQSVDDKKDQTYFLHQLNQNQLSSVLFPLGTYTKSQVRDLAMSYGLVTAEKEESMGICFIGEVSMKQFLMEHGISSSSGPIVHIQTKEMIGTHDGLPFYTIGQRQGLDQKGGSNPLFVIKKEQSTNTLFVGDETQPELYSREIIVPVIHWIDGRGPELPHQCMVRFRHRQPLQSAVIAAHDAGGISITCDTPQQAITSGQFAVLYTKGECVGGGAVE